MMKFNILTIFPEACAAYLNSSILGKAQEKKLIEINIINIRDFATDKHKKTDDEPFGGGPGMVMLAEPIFRAAESLELKKNSRIILTSAQGKKFDQIAAKELAKEKEVTFICGRYEAVDERVAQHLATDEYSIGDYVLTGGELPAMVMLDAISRMIKGVVGKEDSVLNDSFNKNTFDHPHYTRPADFRGWKAPDVLLAGNHKKIEEWRTKAAKEKLKKNRPELI